MQINRETGALYLNLSIQ